MSEVLNNITILAVLALIVFGYAVYTGTISFGDKKKGRIIQNEENVDENVSTFGAFQSHHKGTTKISLEQPTLIIQQLNPRDGRLIKEFPIYKNLMEESISISRSDADYGDVKLSSKCRAEGTVSEEHLWIAKDEKGFFAADKSSTNGTRLPGNAKALKQIDIANGMILFLGDQPIKFIIPQEKELIYNTDAWGNNGFNVHDRIKNRNDEKTKIKRI